MWQHAAVSTDLDGSESVTMQEAFLELAVPIDI